MVTIRRAEAGDLDAVMRLVAATIEGLRAQGLDQWDEVYPARSDFEKDVAADSLFLAFGEGRLLGCFVLNDFQDPEYAKVPWTLAGKVAVVHRLMVDPAGQGRGIARAMMERAEAEAHAAGFTVMRLDTFTQNARALALYEQLGYRRAGFAPFRKGLLQCFEKAL